MNHPDADERCHLVIEALEHAGHLLPAQGPISVFVHHNTLHAFEHLPFHRAVVEAGRVYGAAPYLTQARFRELYAEGRITAADLEPLLLERWRATPTPAVAGVDGRRIERLALLEDLAAPAAAVVRWRVDEGDALRQPCAGLGEAARRQLLAGADAPASALHALWRECAAVPLPATSVVEPEPNDLWTHRDGLLACTGEDANDLVHPIVARYAAAFLDDGSAAWPMPQREHGFFAAWTHLVSTDAAPLPGWLHGLQEQVRGDDYRGRGPAAVVVAALDDLGVPSPRWPAYLTALALHLRGWAGMFHWFETHPDERITRERQVRLLDFIAVRLTYDRRAWVQLARKHFGYEGALRDLAQRARDARALPAGDEDLMQRWRLFLLAQHLGWNAEALAQRDAADRRSLLALVDRFDDAQRRRIWQEAYEGHYRRQVLQALDANQHRPLAARQPQAPSLQVVCCIDEREESLRRHLEEHDASIETFGTAGFFGLAIEYAGLDDGHAVPLCPIVVTPSHAVREVPVADHDELADQRSHRRRRLHRLRFGGRHATQALVRGTLATPLLGAASAVALPAYVFAPRLTARLRDALAARLLPEPRTRLAPAVPAHGAPEDLAPQDFPLADQVERVATTLENIGMTRRFARIVCFLGHGSVSINNPHESAYDCGACGGYHGGANARLFADLANRPEVRIGLRARGIEVPESTVFVGGIHHTSSDAIVFADLDRVPDTHREDLARLRQALDAGRARSAQERCRRFESAPPDPTPQAALRHVEARATALSEPRPELGHCTNAACIVGRRSLSRGVFLDRRAFLVSYDPDGDVSGAILERTLVAVAPVGAGISLEYLFSCVDVAAYGCGTKLPHNVVGMLGVMDGPSSDLRTGLTKQMIEIHEPMRLLLIVEAEPERLEAIAARQAGIRQLVVNEWIQLVSLSPSSGSMRRWTPTGWRDESHAVSEPPRVPSSLAWYRGRRDFLTPALVVAEGGRDAA